MLMSPCVPMNFMVSYTYKTSKMSFSSWISALTLGLIVRSQVFLNIPTKFPINYDRYTFGNSPKK